MSDTKPVYVSGVPVHLIQALDAVATKEGTSRAALMIEGAQAVLAQRKAAPRYRAMKDGNSWVVAEGEGKVVAQGMTKADAELVASIFAARRS